MSPFLALVINFSATGRSVRARDSVVVIRPCSNSAVAGGGYDDDDSAYVETEQY